MLIKHQGGGIRGTVNAVGVLLWVISLCAGADAVSSGDRVWAERPTDRILQEARENKPYSKESFEKLLDENLERSYITAASGFRFGDDQTSPHILYEAQVFHNIRFWPGENFWIDVPVRVVVRQLSEASAPVLTPTYNPGLRVFVRDTSRWCVASYCYGSAGIFHYSNGQNGDPFLPDGSVNTRSGSFSTWYSELAGHWVTGDDVFQWLRFSWRHHSVQNFDDAQKRQYETDHVALTMRTKYFEPPWVAWQLTLTGVYSTAGRKYVIFNPVDPAQNVEAKTGDNLGVTLEFSVLPGSKEWWQKKGLAIYFRYDYGYDYYNINFQHRIDRLQFGLVSTNF